jgi:hypothetical protein
MNNEISSKSGQEIKLHDTCPCFSARKSILAIERICWFCRFAGFDLKEDKLPEWGTCLYKKETKRRRKYR